MSEKIYIIRYKFGSFSNWCYFTMFSKNYEEKDDTCSTLHKDSTEILKMSLKETKKKYEKIKEIRDVIYNDLIDIQIIDTNTNKIIDIDHIEEEDNTATSRFDLIDFD
jgi:hypothetical protein